MIYDVGRKTLGIGVSEKFVCIVLISNGNLDALIPEP